MKKLIHITFLLSIASLLCSAQGIYLPGKNSKTLTLVLPRTHHARLQYGAEKLSKSLKDAGYTVQIVSQDKLPAANGWIMIDRFEDSLYVKAVATRQVAVSKAPAKEGFSISTTKQHNIIITGADNSGALYGCLELADRIRSARKLPEEVSVTDQPEMVLRGTCIGVQKPAYLPGRGVYEYPYTPETFPWLYDKALWVKYLDSLAEYRMNSLYLWNGHPFASLVRLKEYPYAVEVDDATFKKNEEMYKFLTEEADRRGIWVIQLFYNIIVSKPFAEKNGIKTQDRNRPIIPLIADYTRKSIAAFVEKYPNVGIMVTLGEAMEGVGQDDVDWFTKTIIPGVKDGLRALGKTEEPPIVLRAHDTDAPMVMKAALPLYKNLYTEAKYNGEALTTYTPHGSWADLHRTLSRIGTVQIENVHIMANLEPFRYASADFIQKCVQAMHNVYESNGLHLYPESSYWDWPYSADKAGERLLQIDRNWLWYKEWARYAWNCHRDRSQEITYWSTLLGTQFGCSEKQGGDILEAYEQTGEIAPKLLRRYGITDGNRQTLTLGMFMSQLINPNRYGLFTLMYTSEGPPGEMIGEYAEKEWKKETHSGETPVQVAGEVEAHGQKAVEAIERLGGAVTKNRAEFDRVKNDVYCYRALADCYAEKVRAALLVLRYTHSNDMNDLKAAVPHLEKSLAAFQQLADLTKDTYLYANSMQTQQRKIPIGGNNATMKTWVELLPLYQKELANFRRSLDSMTSNAGKPAPVQQAVVLQNAVVTNAVAAGGDFLIGKGQSVFADTTQKITDFAPELKGLKGFKFSRVQQSAAGTSFIFTSSKPVKVLVGFFNSKEKTFLAEPNLETDGSANDYGQSEIRIANGLVVEGLPAVNVHQYSFPAGTNTLTLGKGVSLVLGIVDETQPIRVYDAGLDKASNRIGIERIFE